MTESDIRRKQLQALVDELGLSVAARKLGKPDRQLNDMLAGRKSFGARVAREMEVTGDLPKYYFEDEAKITNKNIGDIKATSHSELPENAYPVKKLPVQIPVIGKSMGGLPDRLFTDEGRPVDGHDEFAEVFSTDEAAFVIRVEGNSMYPKYAPGDYALVEPSTEPELEDDVLIKIKTGEVMLKRLISRRGGIHLGSYNESEPYFFNSDEIIWLYYVAHPIPARKIKSRI